MATDAQMKLEQALEPILKLAKELVVDCETQREVELSKKQRELSDLLAHMQKEEDRAANLQSELESQR